MERNLRVGAYQFRQTFDGELGRTGALQVGMATVRDNNSERYGDRYDLWLNTAVHPRMVANIFLVDSDAGGLRLRRWSPEGRLFESVAWPAEVDKWRTQFEQELREYESGRLDRRPLAIRDDGLMVFPLRNFDGPRAPGTGSRRHSTVRKAVRPPRFS